jgi:hypothetical protein
MSNIYMSDMYEMSYEDPMSLPRKIAQMLKNQGLDRTTENIQELAYPKRLDGNQVAMTKLYYDQLFEQEARRQNKTTSMGGRVEELDVLRRLEEDVVLEEQDVKKEFKYIF